MYTRPCTLCQAMGFRAKRIHVNILQIREELWTLTRSMSSGAHDCTFVKLSSPVLVTKDPLQVRASAAERVREVAQPVFSLREPDAADPDCKIVHHQPCWFGPCRKREWLTKTTIAVPQQDYDSPELISAVGISIGCARDNIEIAVGINISEHRSICLERRTMRQLAKLSPRVVLIA